MLVPFAFLALAVLSQQQSIENPCAHGYTENVWDSRFTPGQQWSYRNRPIDNGSTFVVTKFDQVPGIRVVVHIDVLGVDLIDEPGTVRPLNNSNTVSIAIRRESFDASALQMLKIVQTVGADHYSTWQSNCEGLTYATTLADSIQSEQDLYLARLRTSVLTLGTTRISLCGYKVFKIALTANPPRLQSRPGLSGLITSSDGNPFKDAVIELDAKELEPPMLSLRPFLTSSLQFNLLLTVRSTSQLSIHHSHTPSR